LDGNGSFKITVNLPAGHGITAAKVFKDGAEVDGLTPLAGAIVFEADYASGDYYFSIRLYKNNELYGVVSELVQVRANLLSEKTYTLTREDLKLTYTITYHMDGGQFDNGVETPSWYRSTDAGITLPIPGRAGYDFGGWYAGAELTGSPVTAIPQGSLGDKDFYARWIAQTYTVSFKSNYGADTTLYTRTVTVPAAAIGTENFPANPSRTGYDFAGWNTAANGSGTAFTASTTVSGDITVYARWTNTLITLLNPDAGAGAFSQAAFTLSKSGVNGSQTINVTGTGYTNPRWFVDGDLRGTGTDITISAADYSPGGHNLTLFINKNGVSWSKEISFTVTS
jgi:uncharacterized repeat protein (TIGR02543 family)